MQRVTAITGVVFLIALAILALWSGIATRATIGDVEVHYLGVTNDSKVGKKALFAVTNRTDHVIEYTRDRVEVLTPTGWVTWLPHGAIGFDESIPAGAGNTNRCVAPVPDTAGSWRLVISVMEPPSVGRRIPYMIRNAVRHVIDPAAVLSWGWTSREIYGPEMAQP